MAGLLDRPQLEKLPAVRFWLEHAESTWRIIDEKHSHLADPAGRLKMTIPKNVLVQFNSLRIHPTVAAAFSDKTLDLHGWGYEFETAQVETYTPESGEFAPLGKDTSTILEKQKA